MIKEISPCYPLIKFKIHVFVQRKTVQRVDVTGNYLSDDITQNLEGGQDSQSTDGCLAISQVHPDA